MLCKTELTNHVFKNQENSAKHNLLPFPSLILFYFIYLLKKKNTQNEMHECYAMQILENKKKTKNQRTMVTKNSNEVQGPCQKDLIRLSLLHPKLFRFTTNIGVLIHMEMISNSKIGIKVQSLYQFTNEYHKHFSYTT